MARFTAKRMAFGVQPAKAESTGDELHDGDEDECLPSDDGQGLPTPKLVAASRRFEGIREAKAAIRNLPAPGESLHLVCTARLDLTDLIQQLILTLGAARKMYVATLGYNEKNLSLMTRWLDEKNIGEINLITSLFFRADKRKLWEETLTKFAERGQRAAACHSHAKVVTLEFSSGTKYSIEGSANLCGNGGREQFAIVNDAGLHDWHRDWIDARMVKHA